jgi:hypothetical protein
MADRLPCQTSLNLYRVDRRQFDLSFRSISRH